MDPSAFRADNTSAPRSPLETHPIETKSTFKLHVFVGFPPHPQESTPPQSTQITVIAGSYWAPGRTQVLIKAQKPPAPRGVGCMPINRIWATCSLRSHASMCLLSQPHASQKPSLPASVTLYFILRLPGLTCFYSPLALYNAALSSCHFSFLGIV